MAKPMSFNEYVPFKLHPVNIKQTQWHNEMNKQFSHLVNTLLLMNHLVSTHSL